jgi:serine/threonine-protein kinase
VAPEQAVGDGATQQSDIYALGIVLYEMLTGDVPFKADTHVGVAMKHVREPLPDVQHHRPEVSAMLASIVDRATRKELRNRYSTVDELVHELEEALAIEAARGSQLTGEATTVLRQLPGDTASWIPLRIRSPRRLLAGGAVAVACVAVAIAVLASRTERGQTGDAAVARKAAGLTPVPFEGIDDYDPFGPDHAEHSSSVREAIDGVRSTYWTTEHYRDGAFGNKPGVGLWVRSGASAVIGKELNLITNLPGWEGIVYAAKDAVPDAFEGWTRVSGSFTTKATTKVALDTAGQAFRYYLVWITRLPEKGQAGVMELTLLAQKR